MKKCFFTVALCAALLLALSPAAQAADENAGFYGVGAAAGIEIIPVTASGAAAACVKRDVDGDGADDLFYPGSEALAVTLADTAQDTLYLLTVSSPETLLYADQQVGGGSLSFRASFVLPDRRTELTVKVGSTETGFEMIAVPLLYTPSAPAAAQGSGSASQSSGSAAQSSGSAAVSAPDPEPIPHDTSCEKDGSCPLTAYRDLDAAAWYHDGLHYVQENGIMNGVGDGRFDPNGSTSRAMIVTMLYRAEGEPAVTAANPFRDVADGRWYTEAIRWAAANGIVDGYGDGRFGPDDEITREQLAVILYRCAQSKGQGFTGLWMFLLEYPDAAEVSSWADEAMHWCVMHKIVGGKDGKLVPGGDASRAEAATMLMRYCTGA